MKPYLFSIWLGLSLGIVGFQIMDWEFWFVMAPTVIFGTLFRSSDGE